MERVSEGKYLGVIVDERLDFKQNSECFCKRCQPRIYCLQKLRDIGILQEILENYYRSCVESLLTFSFICWFGSLTVHDKNVLNGVVRVCSKVLGKKQMSLEELYKR